MSEKSRKVLKWILIIVSALAAIKLIFVDYTLDEEYQIVMAYRQISGDALFGTMWEPHQTSAFGCYFIMLLYHFLFRTYDGVIIFVRVVTTLIQFGLSVWIYKVLKSKTKKEYAFLLAIIYFNIVPKLIQIPEFSNMQLWFFTITVLALMNAYAKTKNNFGWIVLAGVGMSLEVLSYPSMLLIFPVFVICIVFLAKGKKKFFDNLVFAGTCGVCGALWLLLVCSKVGFSDFIRNVKYILDFDATHNLNVSEQTKGMVVLSELGETMINFGIIIALSAATYFIVKRVAKKKVPLEAFMILFAELDQLFYWLVLQKGYEKPQILSLVCLLIPFFYAKKLWKKNRLLLPGILGSYAVVAAVLYTSDLGIWNALATGTLGMIWGLMILIDEMDATEEVNRWLVVVLMSLAIVCAFGKGFTVKGGKTPTNTILGVRNVMKNGPSKFIFCHYMQGYIMDCDYEDFEANVPDNAKVLIVTNMFEGAETTPYMFGDYEVCHFSIVDPTTYDEKLLTYWELYPEKQPDIIVVDCWYGTLQEDPENWIMQYIENDFGYSESADGRYVRFYKK